MQLRGRDHRQLLRQADGSRRGRQAGVRRAHDAAAQVWTAWDLGKNNATAIWFAQVVGREVHIIDYYEMTQAELDHYAKIVRDKPYVYAGHILPHDAQAKILGMSNTLEQLEKLLAQSDDAPMHDRGRHQRSQGDAPAAGSIAKCERALTPEALPCSVRSEAERDAPDPGTRLDEQRSGRFPIPRHDRSTSSDFQSNFARTLNYPKQGVA